MQVTPVIKSDNTTRKLPQTTSVEITPNSMHLDVPIVQHGTLECNKCGHIEHCKSKCRGSALPIGRMGKHNTQKRQKVPWEEGTY